MNLSRCKSIWYPPKSSDQQQSLSLQLWFSGLREQGYLWPSAWGGMCRWTRNKSIFGAEHMLAVVHSRSWAVWLQHQINCGGMGEGKASEWVWRSNCYHTWQCLVWDPVVHAAYVSGWSSVRQSDRVWRVTRHIRSRQRMCLTDHRNFTPAQSFASTHIVRPTWSFQVHIWGLIYSTLTPIFCLIHTFLKPECDENSQSSIPIQVTLSYINKKISPKLKSLFTKHFQSC